MRSRRRATIEDLRVSIQALPRTTRVAMLEGIRANEIIVGAYTDGHGICPMLAAHRAGGRTNLISFAKAWDRFALAGAGGARVLKPRPATARELLVLRTHLESTLLEEDAPEGDLGAAIVEHRELVARREQTPRASAPQARPKRPTPPRDPATPTAPRSSAIAQAGAGPASSAATTIISGRSRRCAPTRRRSPRTQTAR